MKCGSENLTVILESNNARPRSGPRDRSRDVWNRRTVYLSIALALTAVPFYVEGIYFQNLYIILAGDLPLFASATRIWRIRAAKKHARSVAKNSSTSALEPKEALTQLDTGSYLGRDAEGDRSILPEPRKAPAPDSEVAPQTDGSMGFRGAPTPLDNGPSGRLNLPSKPRTNLESGVKLKPKPIKFQRSSKGLRKPAYLCKCGHVHITNCMTCGMTMKSALKGRRTRWTDWANASKGPPTEAKETR